MLKRVWIAAALLILAACEIMSSPPTPTTTTLQNTGVASSLAAPTADMSPRWIETENNGVALGCWQPSGWTIDTSEGVLLAEHAASIGTGEPPSGVMIYIFVPEIEHLEVAPDDEHNFAMSVLRQVATNPEHTGHDVAVSDPAPFVWGAHDAAYYLLSSSQGFKAIVIGIALPDDHERLVVINMTVPTAQAAHMRRILPRVLDDLQINDVKLNGTALDALPDPLAFPTAPRIGGA
jgi:hypothetical protein